MCLRVPAEVKEAISKTHAAAVEKVKKRKVAKDLDFTTSAPGASLAPRSLGQPAAPRSLGQPDIKVSIKVKLLLLEQH